MQQPRAPRSRGPGARPALARLLAVVLLAGLLRAGVAAWTFPVTPLGDELYYSATAVSLASGEGHVFGPHRMRARWPPGQAALLAPFVREELLIDHPALLEELARRAPDELEPRHRRFLAPLVAVEVATGTLVVAATGALAWALFGPATAPAAAALAAVYPAFVAGSHYLWSETLFTLLLTLGLAAAVFARGRGSLALAAAAGAVFGAATLTREVAALVACAWVAWTLAAGPKGARRRSALHGAALLLALACVVAPWTWRNFEIFGRLVPVSTVGWMGLREGNTLAEDAWFERDWEAVREFRRRYVAIPDEMERLDTARREALERIRAAQPGWLARKLVLNLGELVSPGGDLFVKLRQGAYGDVPPVRALFFTGLAAAVWALALLAAALGAAASPDGSRRWLPVALYLPVVLLHVMANAFPKYRVPLLPLLLCYAAWAWTGRGQRRALDRRAPAAAALAVAAALLILGLWRFLPQVSELAGPASEPTAAAAPGRIVLLSMDTVRADRVSGYGAEAPTPALAALARQGVLFRDSHAASNYTIPSHMSLFTGLDPAAHGVLREDARLSPEVPTLAELLREAGYTTRAFHEGGYVEARFGFARGFEVYRRYPRVEVVREALPAVLDWMREHRDEPYLLFLHTYAAHFPYGGFERHRLAHPERGLPDAQARARLPQLHPSPDGGLLPESERRRLPSDLQYVCTLYNQLAESHGELLPCGGYLPDERMRASPQFAEDHAAVLRSYDERVRLVDEAVGRLRATLEELGQWEDTLFVVSSDHGEAFYEHGLLRHDYVPYEEVMRVPLIVSYPRWIGERGSRVVEGPVWHLDLAPTLLALAGVEAPSGLPGLDLSAVLRGVADVPAGRAIFPAVLRSAHLPPLPLRRVVLSGGLKWIQPHPSYGAPRGALYDLAADPQERRDLAPERADEARALDALAAVWERGIVAHPPVDQDTGRPLGPREEAAPGPLAPELRERLRDLGYAE